MSNNTAQKRYHIVKATRGYYGRPYCGYSSNYKPMEFDELREAKEAVERLNDFNPVGWDIYDTVKSTFVEKRLALR